MEPLKTRFLKRLNSPPLRSDLWPSLHPGGPGFGVSSLGRDEKNGAEITGALVVNGTPKIWTDGKTSADTTQSHGAFGWVMLRFLFNPKSGPRW